MNTTRFPTANQRINQWTTPGQSLAWLAVLIGVLTPFIFGLVTWYERTVMLETARSILRQGVRAATSQPVYSVSIGYGQAIIADDSMTQLGGSTIQHNLRVAPYWSETEKETMRNSLTWNRDATCPRIYGVERGEIICASMEVPLPTQPWLPFAETVTITETATFTPYLP